VKIVITGAAGLVGQNLIPRIKARGIHEIVALDKHAANIRILRELHPDIAILEADLATPGAWMNAFENADAVVVAHAQIGGLAEDDFVRNNIAATRLVADAIVAAGVPYVVNISSSVVNSAAVDWYTETKKAQEQVLQTAGFTQVVLRPTLMFGWFDRKHLGWLGRFLRRSPIFPVPGDGRYPRQPLYAGDFCNIIAACIERRTTGAYNISGLERVDYIDLIRLLRTAVRARTPVVKIPYGVFRLLLQAYSLVDSDPPFTTKQLAALVTPDIFEVIDWPGIFGVPATPLAQAMRETFQDARYSQVALEY
jgi:nucleoside-diphosphate-sugar epimerase